MPKKQLSVNSDSVENLEGSATTRSRRRGDKVNYRESPDEGTFRKAAPVPDIPPEQAAPPRKKAGKVKKVVIVENDEDLDIFGVADEQMLPPPGPSVKEVRKGRKKKALTENQTLNQQTEEILRVPVNPNDVIGVVPEKTGKVKSKHELAKKDSESAAASALNSTYVKENDLNNLQQVTEGSAAEGEEDMIPHAVTGGGGLNLSEDSSEDEEVEEKEKRRQRRQAEENPFSFKKYVEKVKTGPEVEKLTAPPNMPEANGRDLAQDARGNIQHPSSSSSIDSLENLSLYELRHSNAKMNDEIHYMEHQLANRNRRIEELENELKEMRKREARETESLDKQLRAIEKNHNAAIERIKVLEIENFRLHERNEKLQRGETVIPEDFVCKQQDLANKLRAVATEGEQQINAMLKGVKDLQQLSQLLESLHKISEDNVGAMLKGVKDLQQLSQLLESLHKISEDNVGAMLKGVKDLQQLSQLLESLHKISEDNVG